MAEASGAGAVTRPSELESLIDTGAGGVINKPGRKKKRISAPALEDIMEDGKTSFAFGVRSYLHKFYDGMSCEAGGAHSGPDGYRYLIKPPRASCAHSLWWRLSLYVGIAVIMTGCGCLLFGNLIPAKTELVGYRSNVPVIDKSAQDFNSGLETAKLTGLIMLCSGGMVTALSLLIPTFFKSYMDESPEFRLKVDDPALYVPGGNGNGHEDCKPIPVSTMVASVQPTGQDEAASQDYKTF